jgi:hypothetical protein
VPTVKRSWGRPRIRSPPAGALPAGPQTPRAPAGRTGSVSQGAPRTMQIPANSPSGQRQGQRSSQRAARRRPAPNATAVVALHRGQDESSRRDPHRSEPPQASRPRPGGSARPSRSRWRPRRSVIPLHVGLSHDVRDRRLRVPLREHHLGGGVDDPGAPAAGHDGRGRPVAAARQPRRRVAARRHVARGVRKLHVRGVPRRTHNAPRRHECR